MYGSVAASDMKSASCVYSRVTFKQRLDLRHQRTLSPACALSAEILGEWVGLRPGRPSVRLDVEIVEVTKPVSLPWAHLRQVPLFLTEAGHD